MKDKLSDKNWFLIAGFLVALFTLLVGLGAVWSQLKTANDQMAQGAKISSAQYVLQMSNKLDETKYDKIRVAIENNPSSFRLLKPNGAFDINALESYMGELDTIGSLVRDGVINQQMAYDAFDYEVEKAYCNKDLSNDINADRILDKVMFGPDAFFSGFEDLAKTFLNRDKKNCALIDQEG